MNTRFAVVYSSLLRLSAALVLTATTTDALAADAPSDKEKDKSVLDARRKFREAIALQTGGNWAAALSEFREVANIKNTPQVRFNIAICEENLGQLVTALGDYQLAATQAREEGSTQVASEVDGRLATLQARIPKIVLKRGENASLAKISIDGVEVGSSTIGTPMPVDPGGHQVEAVGRGLKKFEKSFEVTERQETTIEVVMELAPVDQTGTAGPAAPGDQGPVAQKEEGRSIVLPLVIGGVGAASLITSGVFFILRQGAISDLDSSCPSRQNCDPALQDKASSGKTYSTVSLITLGVGVAGLGTGAALFFIGNGSGKSPEAALVPGASRADVGASLIGRF
jgi:hypothetical protein